MDQFDWTEGIYVKTARVGAQTCASKQLGQCFPEPDRGRGSTESFGYNWTHPSLPPARPWEHFTESQLGSASSLTSAAIPSVSDRQASRTALYINVRCHCLSGISGPWLHRHANQSALPA